jgi:hypothetical protein
MRGTRKPTGSTPGEVPDVEAQPASAEAAVKAEKERKLRRERGFSKFMTRD